VEWHVCRHGRYSERVSWRRMAGGAGVGVFKAFPFVPPNFASTQFGYAIRRSDCRR
jgi:hypothetical protein